MEPYIPAEDEQNSEYENFVSLTIGSEEQSKQRKVISSHYDLLWLCKGEESALERENPLYDMDPLIEEENAPDGETVDHIYESIKLRPLYARNPMPTFDVSTITPTYD